jgi:putative oxidoreductase
MTAPEFAYLLARLLTCGIWIAAGLYKATHYEHTIAEINGHGIPMARVVLPLVLVLELVGSALLIADVFVWGVAIAWLVFLIPASYIYHMRFMIRDGTIDFLQWVMFWKNVSIAGGLFALILLDTSRPGWLFGAA